MNSEGCPCVFEYRWYLLPQKQVVSTQATNTCWLVFATLQQYVNERFCCGWAVAPAVGGLVWNRGDRGELFADRACRGSCFVVAPGGRGRSDDVGRCMALSCNGPTLYCRPRTETVLLFPGASSKQSPGDNRRCLLCTRFKGRTQVISEIPRRIPGRTTKRRIVFRRELQPLSRCHLCISRTRNGAGKRI